MELEVVTHSQDTRGGGSVNSHNGQTSKQNKNKNQNRHISLFVTQT